MSVSLDNLAPYIAAKQAEKKVVQTGRDETPTLSKAMETKKLRGGSEQEISVRNGDQATNTKFYNPDDPVSDFVGSVAGENNYTAIQPVVKLKFAWSFNGTDLRYSGIQLQQYKTAGDAQLASYLDDRLEFSEEEARESIGSGIINGTGNGYQGTLAGVVGTNLVNPYGLIYQDRNFSGTPNANTSNAADNTHFGQPRHLHSELVGNVLNATTGYGTTIADTGTFVVGSTEISGLASTVFTPQLGWEIWVDFGAGFEHLGREYVVADADTAAATTLQMSTIFRGVAGSYPVEFRAPFNVATHGAAGVLTTAKLNKLYFQCSDGKRSPTQINSDTTTFGAVSNFLVDVARWNLVKDADFAAKGYNNFMYQNATWCADNNYTRGTIQYLTGKHTNLYCLRGQDDYMIKASDLIELPSQAGYKQFGANTTMAFQMVSESPRSNGIINGLDI
ncbi:hypothetical protein [uncultured Paraglaciecola sp.]|uniref:hypothetical protein n=1 Tax=uncultured Paraglaciecola sp. TaxID=1765024 RepID=UPI0026265683|nr:hypothetical protein [uncultured Paraglaciecola sp.]